MKNPWLAVPAVAPFILPADSEIVERFNQTASPKTRIDLNLLPEPFQGNPEAPVVLLGLNPGLSGEDAATHADTLFAERLRANLAHDSADYPFYLLHPEVRGPGRNWWDRRLRRVLETAPRQRVAQRLLCIEYFPYHSVRFAARLRVPSQDYGFHLARQAVRRGAVVVIMRSHRLWYAAVPELKSYERAFSLRSVRNISVTPNNCPLGFPAIVRAMDVSAS